MEITDFNPWWKTGSISEEYKRLRKRHLFDELIKYINEKQAIILSGLRRTGKTVILYHIIDYLLNEKISPEKIIYFNFDLAVNDLEEIFEKYLAITKIDYKKEKIFVFLDEVQKLDNWQNKIKLIYDNYKNVKFFISGSSSLFIEKKANESLGGRVFSFQLSPLKFSEYLLLRGENKILEKSALFEKEFVNKLEHYMKIGGFPELLDEYEDFKIKKYIKELIIDKIVYIDIPEVFEIEEPELLQRLISIISSQPGIRIDYDSIASDLSRNRKTISNYLFYLEKAFLIKKIYNFSRNLLTSEKKKKKFYPSSTGLAFLYGADKGNIAENILLQNNDFRFFYRKGNKEVDFIYEDNKKIIPLESKARREIKKDDKIAILDFMKNFDKERGIFITDNKEGEENIEWFGTKRRVKYIPLLKWLLIDKKSI